MYTPNFNILIYIHDSCGMEYIYRLMDITRNFRDAANTNILVLTDFPITDRLFFSEQVDFVHIPGLIKTANNEYKSFSINIHTRQVIKMRMDIIRATAKTFLPNMFIVDQEPFGINEEILPTLKWLWKYSPSTIKVFSLSCRHDNKIGTHNDWLKKDEYCCLDDLYDEIWIYGESDGYDCIKKTAFSA